MAALARRRPVGDATAGDTIATVPRYPNPVQLCVEDPDARTVASASQANLFKIRLANNEERRNSASYLIRRRYAWRGYSVGDHPTLVPNRITIAAYDDRGTAGTVTVGLDSRETLFVDGLYAEEANALRRDGRKLVEFTKLAVENDIDSKPLLAALFHIAYIYARRIHGGTDLLIEVNPRHQGFYRRMLGFEAFGPLRGDPRVGAPAVLLRLCLAWGQGQIEAHGGTSGQGSASRSLYPFFFGARDEMLIERRMRAFG